MRTKMLMVLMLATAIYTADADELGKCSWEYLVMEYETGETYLYNFFTDGTTSQSGNKTYYNLYGCRTEYGSDLNPYYAEELDGEYLLGIRLEGARMLVDQEAYKKWIAENSKDGMPSEEEIPYPITTDGEYILYDFALVEGGLYSGASYEEEIRVEKVSNYRQLLSNGVIVNIFAGYEKMKDGTIGGLLLDFLKPIQIKNAYTQLTAYYENGHCVVNNAYEEEPPLFYPFLKEGKRWVFHRTNDWNADYDYSYTVEGDTLIGGKAYKKVYEANEYSYKDNQPHYRAALREDGPTVFMVDRDHPAEDEHLLYDFEQGETYVYDEIVHQCVAQDEISVRGREYRRMTIRELSEEDRQGSDMFLVEGIGLQYCDLLEPCGWTYPGSFVTSMLSCWEGDECIFTLSDFDGSSPTGIENEELRMKNEESRGGVYDLQGRLVSRGYGGTCLAPSHPRTPAPSMKKGVYIVSGRKYVVK